MKTYKTIEQKDLPFIEGDEWSTKGYGVWTPVIGADIDPRFEYRRPISSVRPFDLSASLEDPPIAPVGTRWECVDKGRAMESSKKLTGFFEVVWGSIFDGPAEGIAHYYLEAVPLRPVPCGVADVPLGFEYFGQGPLKTQQGQTIDCIAFNNIVGQWDISRHCGNCLDNIYALRIGSKIHHENIVSQGNAWDEADLEPEEPVMNIIRKGATLMTTEEYQELKSDLATATDIIRRSVTGWDVKVEAFEFLKKFEPPFDWDALWSALPYWSNHVVMDNAGSWFGLATKPTLGTGSCWSTTKSDGWCMIPKDAAPPAVTDWKSSLRERPGHSEK